MSSESINYFHRAVMDYSRGDVDALLTSNIGCAGPLLSVTVNGIDITGGICFGFDMGSTYRSTEFMVEHMKIPKKQAIFLYRCVRCGIAHQGMPKVGVKFFLMPERFIPEVILFRDGYEIYLNVTEFAHSYLNAIKRIAENPTSYALHNPPLQDKDEDSFFDALPTVTKDITELCDAVADSDRAEEEAQLARGEIEHMSSLSAYFLDNTLNISFEV